MKIWIELCGLYLKRVGNLKYMDWILKKQQGLFPNKEVMQNKWDMTSQNRKKGKLSQIKGVYQKKKVQV